MYPCIVILGVAATWQGVFATSKYSTEVEEPRRFQADNTREYLVNYRNPSGGYNMDMNRKKNVRKEADNFREYQADSKRIANMAVERDYWKQGSYI